MRQCPTCGYPHGSETVLPRIGDTREEWEHGAIDGRGFRVDVYYLLVCQCCGDWREDFMWDEESLDGEFNWPMAEGKYEKES